MIKRILTACRMASAHTNSSTVVHYTNMMQLHENTRVQLINVDHLRWKSTRSFSGHFFVEREEGGDAHKFRLLGLGEFVARSIEFMSISLFAVVMRRHKRRYFYHHITHTHMDSDSLYIFSVSTTDLHVFCPFLSSSPSSFSLIVFGW